MRFRIVAMIGMAFAAIPISPAAIAAPAAVGDDITPALASAIERHANGAVRRAYASRGFQPLWFSNGTAAPRAQMFLQYLVDAGLDDLKSSRYRPEDLRIMIARVEDEGPDGIARAEIALSEAFARYVRDSRRAKDVGIDYADPRLKPRKLSTERILRAAFHAPSFDRYLQSMGWMSLHYVKIRELLRLAREQRQGHQVIDTIRLNLERARHLPSPSVRHVVVNAASGRLWYYQAGKEVGSMKVVVGAKETQTPLMAGTLTHAIVNPYWNVPDYLVRNNVARKILSGRTLASMKMEVLSDWSPSATKLDPATINWEAVAADQLKIRVRELPGTHNSMGKVKFMFPNDQGIYLHDTPNRDLFAREDRHLSNGCIRLERATALGRWMMGKALDIKAKKAKPEMAIPMAAPVPVYLTYLTATRTRQGISLMPDIYGLDRRKP